MVSTITKPEDMLEIMNSIMDKMFSKMTAKNRFEFASTRMSNCLNMIFPELNAGEKYNLAEGMIEKMISIFQSQLKSEIGQ